MTAHVHAYQDAALPVDARVRDLLERMTLEEKAAQVMSPFGATVDLHTPPSTGWGGATAALSTLGLPPQETASRGNELQRKHVEETRLGIPVLLAEEALIGLKVQDATTFPDAIAQAATWEPPLIERMARTIGVQMARMGVRQALSPLADVTRDPRWGRVEETYGEEPYLVGSMATAFVRGLQNADPDSPVIATLKHFIGYGASDGGRNTEPAHVGPRELREVYGLPFEMALRDGGARGVMPAYNTIDGVPVSGSKAYLTGLLRDEYGFEGLVISDLGAVTQLYTKHGTAPDNASAIGQAMRAGVDLDLETRDLATEIVGAVTTGLLSETDLDRAVASVLRAKFELGLFERPYVDLDAVPETLDSEQERALARTLAEKAIVLLKNDPVDGTPLLPLDDTPRSIAVIGPNADRLMGQLGNYSYQVLDSMTKRFALAADPQARMERAEGTGADNAELLVKSVPVVTFLDGIRARAPEGSTVLYERGCKVATIDRSGFEAAVRAATAADVAIVVVGDQSGINAFGTVGEGLDSADCELPGVQRELVEAVVATGTPTIVVLSHGRPYVLGWMAKTVPAILTAFFGGEEAGNAVASVLFGDVNPAGRLPIAMLDSVGAAPVPYWRTLQARAGAKDVTAAVFPFGHGLSYTSFEYGHVVAENPEVPTDGTIRLSFTVKNIGARAGEEVVQVYGRDVIGRTARRTRNLVGFQRISLEPAAAVRVSLEVPTSMFALWDDADGWVVEPGLIRFYIGASSADTRLQARVTLTGSDHQPGPGRRLASRITVAEVDADALSGPDAAQESTAEGPLTPIGEESTVLEWLEHPVGGELLRGILGGVDEEVLAPAFGVTLTQMVAFSGGKFPQSSLDDLLAKLPEAFRRRS
jgi:beta-glucosidase